ncbi:MAG: ACT domain-containing protein [Oscillospiraceae bacterium]|jgi:ACT domain-containing protein|nr:ACT domain-containing protein [Clostridiales bacterium]MDD4094627.1 ACT domain-containing protein [Oscillospiraceae bacterium]
METGEQKTAVMTVVGSDAVGIIARISDLLYRHNVNIKNITQSILEDIFTMIMMVDLTAGDIDIKDLSEELNALGEEIHLSISIWQTDLFNAMHRI